MPLPVVPPVEPMLAKLSRMLPIGDYRYEPKWDGFRAVLFRDGDDVELRSRRNSDFGRYFPELVLAAKTVGPARFVIDGEIVVSRPGGSDFDALLKRIHPARRHVARMAADAPASFIAFDVLAVGDEDVRMEPYLSRRTRLSELVGDGARPLSLTPMTADAAEAEEWLARPPNGIDGVVAKHRDLTYQEGKRAMVKVKREHTADCVVAGCRVFADGAGVASLLLGLYDRDEQLHHVGVVGSFRADRRRALLTEVAPYAVALEDHPWRNGFALEGGAMGRLPGSAGRWTPDMPLDWLPLRPLLVCEAAYDQVDGRRWRHPGRFVRWRPDRDPRSCRLDQLDAAAAAMLPVADDRIGGRP